MSSTPIHEQCLLAFLQQERPEETGQYLAKNPSESAANGVAIPAQHRYVQKPKVDKITPKK
jgi:hypothetical protein